MSVLVIGASGYIGLNVAISLRMDGWHVYAQTRSEEKAHGLLLHELDPVVCEPTDADTLLPLLTGTPAVSAVVDCAANYADEMAIPTALLDMMRQAQGRDGVHGHKMLYVCTSGLLMCGDRGVYGKAVTEAEPCTNVPLYSARLERDTFVCGAADDGIATAVIRPGFVYGGTGGFTAHDMWWQPLEDKIDGDGKLRIDGNPKRKWAWVHCFDLAQMYTKLVRAPRNAVSGEVFLAGSQTAPTMQEFLMACARLQGWEGTEEDTATGGELQGFWAKTNLTILIDDQKARDVLGYQPRHNDVLAALPIIYRSFEAQQGRA